MGLARLDVLLVAALVSSPTFWSAFVDGTESVETALLRYVIALPICALAMGLVRKLFQGYALQAVATKVRDKAAEREPDR
jgi:hypothetical protein